MAQPFMDSLFRLDPAVSRSEGDLAAVEAGKKDAHIRLNLATSRANVELAATRLAEALKKRL